MLRITTNILHKITLPFNFRDPPTITYSNLITFSGSESCNNNSIIVIRLFNEASQNIVM